MALLVEREMESAVLEGFQERLRQRAGLDAKRRELEAYCSASFLNFLPFWHFINRESGEVCRMVDRKAGRELWPGQAEFADLAGRELWIYALKAGKLGFTELECAFDGWRLRFGPQNCRVHLFSRDDRASTELLGYVKFGLEHLPEVIRPIFLEDEAGGETTHSLKFRMGTDDDRICISYAAGPKVSIDQSCQHAHVDELGHMQHAEKTWNAVATTIAPEGTCHVVTRGSGEAHYAATLWASSKNRSSKLYPLFRDWQSRPDRNQAWYDEQAGSLTVAGLHQFAPATDEEALAGDEQTDFLPIHIWDRCKEDLPPLEHGRGGPLVVLAADAGVRNDCFAIVAVTRHPERHEDVAVRGVRVWVPPPGGDIDFEEPEDFVRSLAFGGCALGHWRERLHTPAWGVAAGKPSCPACSQDPPAMLEPLNLYEVAFDPYQLESVAQKQRKEGINWQPFGQQADRLKADSLLRDLAISGRIAHNGDLTLREHISNAAAKIEAVTERSIRIVKKSQERKVDAAVAVSMGTYRCLELYF